jgi:hypothetical protein
VKLEDHCFNAVPPGQRDAVSCVTLSMAIAAIEQARKEEREACALISQNCQYKLPFNWPGSNLWNHEVHTPTHAGLAIAAAIRARKP